MRPFVSAALLLLACSSGKTHHVPPPEQRFCGDGNLDVDLGEQCDGSNLDGHTCQTEGFDLGQLNCSSTCQLDTALCTKHCGNGVVDATEACDGDAGVSACPSYGFNACSATCTLDVSHCVAVLLVEGPGLTQVAGGAATLGDVDPKGPGDLVQVVPTFGRVELFQYVMGQGFPMSRKLSFFRSPEEALAADLDGDGRQDVAVRNVDGSLDAYLAGATAFSLASFPDAGCGFDALLGVERPKDGGAGAVLALGCADAGVYQAALFARGVANPVRVEPLTATVGTTADFDGDGLLDVLAITPAGALRVAPGSGAAAFELALPATPTALSAGDLDGDGDLDLLVVAGGQLHAWENTGSGFAERQNLGGTSPVLPRVADVDLDALPDALWVEGGALQLRRNLGSFSFASISFPLGSGTPLSLDVGDVDGDGDPDVEVTASTGGAGSQTWLYLNQVR